MSPTLGQDSSSPSSFHYHLSLPPPPPSPPSPPPSPPPSHPSFDSLVGQVAFTSFSITVTMTRMINSQAWTLWR